MKPLQIATLGVAFVLVAASAFYIGRMDTGHTSAPGPAVAGSAPAPAGRTVLYWHDPMVPGQRFDKPGKSPFMDMQLVPVYAESGASSGVQVSAAVQQNLGIRYATVRRATLSSSFDAIGTVQFDERRSVAVQTRVAGYVEHLAVRAPMERVRKGQALATVFAPDWIGPQNELIALQRSGVSEDMIAAARARLRTLSVPDDLVRRSEQSGAAQARFTLASPANGVVAELGVREGVAVTPGMTLFRIAGLETVWAVAEVPESQAARLTRGQKVKATLQADASQTFDGELKEILPEVSTAARTLKARFEVDNRTGRLTPGMLLRLAVSGPQSERLVVPSEAVIRTGERAVVILRNAQGGFEPRDVALGLDFGDDVEIVSGVEEGDRVVASGQFLIDSEARLRSVLGNMSATAPATAASTPGATVGAIHDAEGRVENATADSLTISHGPVATLKWPAMTMGFSKPDPKAFSDVRAGDTVQFRFKEGGASGYELVEVRRMPAGATK
ncbi:MAG: efflux RND transporter periplasmic adaptor subunit [Caldimonas sp.]